MYAAFKGSFKRHTNLGFVRKHDLRIVLYLFLICNMLNVLLKYETMK